MDTIFWIILFIYAGMAVLMWLLGIFVWLTGRNSFLSSFEKLVGIRNMIGLYAVGSIIVANVVYLVAGNPAHGGTGSSEWLYFSMGLLDITGIYLAGLWFLLTGVRRNLERAAEPENPQE